MKFKYEKHSKYPGSVLIRNFIERVKVDDIIESWEYLLSNRIITEKTKGVVNNLSECQLDMNVESFRKLINYLKKTDALRNLCQAVVCDDPRTIVFPMIGEQEEKELKIKVFSTIDAGVHWIMSV